MTTNINPPNITKAFRPNQAISGRVIDAQRRL